MLAVMPERKKLRVGVFSFMSCEGCALMLLNVLDEHEQYDAMIEFKHARLFRNNAPLQELDVAFIEGSIATLKDERLLKEIREKSRKLILLGGCAVNGWPSTQRNNLAPALRESMQSEAQRLGQLDAVRLPGEIVRVDGKISGCAVSGKDLEVLLGKLCKEFKV